MIIPGYNTAYFYWEDLDLDGEKFQTLYIAVPKKSYERLLSGKIDNKYNIDFEFISKFYNDLIVAIKKAYLSGEAPFYHIGRFPTLTSIPLEAVFSRPITTFPFDYYFKVVEDNVSNTELLARIQKYLDNLSGEYASQGVEENPIIKKYREECISALSHSSGGEKVFVILNFTGLNTVGNLLESNSVFDILKTRILKHKSKEEVVRYFKESILYKNVKFLLELDNFKDTIIRSSDSSYLIYNELEFLRRKIIEILEVTSSNSLDEKLFDKSNPDEIIESYKNFFYKLTNLEDFPIYGNPQVYEKVLKMKKGLFIPKEDQEAILIDYASIDESLKVFLKDNFFVNIKVPLLYFLAKELFTKRIISGKVYISIGEVQYSLMNYFHLLSSLLSSDIESPLSILNKIQIQNNIGSSIYFIPYSFNIYLFFYLFNQIFLVPVEKYGKDFVFHYFKRRHIHNVEINLDNYYHTLYLVIKEVLLSILVSKNLGISLPKLEASSSKELLFQLLKFILETEINFNLGTDFKASFSIIERLLNDEDNKILLTSKVSTYLTEIHRPFLDIAYPSYYEDFFNFSFRKSPDNKAISFGFSYKDEFHEIISSNLKSDLRISSALKAGLSKRFFMNSKLFNDFYSFFNTFPKNFAAYFHTDFIFYFSDVLIQYNSGDVYKGELQNSDIETAATLYYNDERFIKEIKDYSLRELKHFLQYGDPITGKIEKFVPYRAHPISYSPMGFTKLLLYMPRSSIYVNMNFVLDVYSKIREKADASLLSILYGFIDHEYKHNYYYHQHFDFSKILRRVKGNLLFKNSPFYLNGHSLNIAGDTQLNQEIFIFLPEYTYFPYSPIFNVPALRSYLDYIVYYYIHTLYSLPKPPSNNNLSSGDGDGGDGDGGDGDDSDSSDNEDSESQEGEDREDGSKGSEGGSAENSNKDNPFDKEAKNRPDAPKNRNKDEMENPKKKDISDENMSNKSSDLERDVLTSSLNLEWRIFSFFKEIETLVRYEKAGKTEIEVPSKPILTYSPPDIESELVINNMRRNKWNPIGSAITPPKAHFPSEIPTTKKIMNSIEVVAFVDSSGSMRGISESFGVSYYTLALLVVKNFLRLGVAHAYVIEFDVDISTLYSIDKPSEVTIDVGGGGGTNFLDTFERFTRRDNTLLTRFPLLKEVYNSIDKGWCKLIIIFGDLQDSLDFLKRDFDKFSYKEVLDVWVNSKTYVFFCPVDYGEVYWQNPSPIAEIESNLTKKFLKALGSSGSKNYSKYIRVVFPFALK